jgi:DNA-binding HxlR family transcriptional regulator
VTGKRKYGDGCAAAHALDLIGERWGLLIVRELLLGPKRFTELQAGLPNASSNALSQRLHELEESGVVQRRKLGPPAAVWVYELTEWGLDLEPVLIHLGRWGRRSSRRDPHAIASVDALMLALRSHFDPDADPGLSVTIAVRLGDDRFSVRVSGGTLTISRADPADPAAVIDTDLRSFAALVIKKRPLKDLPIAIKGDEEAVHRLLATL